MRSNPVVRTPQDAKTLVDAAERAIKLAEKLKGGEHDPGEAERSKEWLRNQMQILENWVRLAHTAAGRARLIGFPSRALYRLSEPSAGSDQIVLTCFLRSC
jgi:hypothetical protein